MKVRVLNFAVLREIVGKAAIDLSLADGARARDVWQSMRRDYGALAAYEQPPLVAINESYATPDTVLHDGDELAFIPPVAGG